MQKYYAAILLLVLCVSCQNSQTASTNIKAPSSEAVNVAPENLSELKFDVRGMSCTDCENTISKSVKELPGIAEIKASYTDSFALVKFDKTKTNAEEIKKAIESKGYEVKGFTAMKN
jgi:copper chaperone CopZ